MASGRAWPKVACGAAILAVAVVAGIISYSHIYELTLSLHQSKLTARLMPAAIDGLITVGSVVLLQSGSRLGWLGIGPGLALSVFANLESGIRYGWLAATWAAIPAVSFFLASFILEHWLKGQARKPVTESASATVPDVPGTVPTAAPVLVTEAHPRVHPSTRRSTPKPVNAKPAVRRARVQSPSERYAAEIAAGEVPSLRRIKADCQVGQEKAKQIQAELSAAPDGAALAA